MICTELCTVEAELSIRFGLLVLSTTLHFDSKYLEETLHSVYIISKHCGKPSIEAKIKKVSAFFYKWRYDNVSAR